MGFFDNIWKDIKSDFDPSKTKVTTVDCSSGTCKTTLTGGVHGVTVTGAAGHHDVTAALIKGTQNIVDNGGILINDTGADNTITLPTVHAKATPTVGTTVIASTKLTPTTVPTIILLI